jgi:predicted O-linked N-acetylglucosamine transferase (SPINDLY family)
VGNCQFVFRQYSQSYPVTKQFEKRLEAVFQKYGQDWSDYVVMLPWLPKKKYQRVQQLADIYLDTIGWSGGTTTLEALAYDLPVVTLPGEFFRTRMSYGILKQMGVLDTVADSLDDYIEIAVRLGNDPSDRTEIMTKMHARNRRVYCDQDAIQGLEQFLESVVGEERE